MKIKHLKFIANPQAFNTGFFNGLGAPAVLFSDFYCPTIKTFSADEFRLYKPVDGLRQDWEKIGGDFKFAVEQHAKVA